MYDPTAADRELARQKAIARRARKMQLKEHPPQRRTERHKKSTKRRAPVR